LPRPDAEDDGAFRRHGLEPVVRESRTARTEVVYEPGGARGRADRAEAYGCGCLDDADVRQPVLEGAIEAQLAPTAARLGPERRYLAGSGGKFTDDTEREIERRFLSSASYW